MGEVHDYDYHSQHQHGLGDTPLQFQFEGTAKNYQFQCKLCRVNQQGHQHDGGLPQFDLASGSNTVSQGEIGQSYEVEQYCEDRQVGKEIDYPDSTLQDTHLEGLTLLKGSEVALVSIS